MIYTDMFLIEFSESWPTVLAYRSLCISKENVRKCLVYGPTVDESPLFVFSGVLQPRHVTVLTANFMRPPMVGVAIWTVLV
jgi:hypothetical protein